MVRLYFPTNDGRTKRGLIAEEDCVIQAELGLVKYVAESNERLIIAVRYETRSTEESPSEYKQRNKNERVQEVHGKKLHGQFFK